MQLAAWLDVALEGGVTELERALSDYRALRRLLVGDWRMHAVRVAELTEHVRERWADVDSALERARRRARTDEEAASGLQLVERVEKEKTALELQLRLVCRARPLVAAQLDWLCDAANEEADYERSMIRFRMERIGWTVLMLALALTVPLATWFVASAGGSLGTIFDLSGLAEPGSLILMFTLLASIAVSALRLSSWSWLGVRMPVLFSPLVVSGLFAMTAAATMVSFAVRDPAPFLAAIGCVAAIGVPASMHGWWRKRDTRASDMDAVSPSSSER